MKTKLSSLKLWMIVIAIALSPALIQAQGAKDVYRVKSGDNVLRVMVFNRTQAPFIGLTLRFPDGQPPWFNSQKEENADLWTNEPLMVELPFQVSAPGVLTEAITLELRSQGKSLGIVQVFLDGEVVSGRIAGPANSHQTGLVPSSENSILSSETQEEVVALPTEYALGQNFPNPFNPTTTIQYDLPQAGWVVLKIYDALGREVRTLVRGDNPAGRHTVLWNGSNDEGVNLSSGMYIYRLTAGTFEQTRKMLLVR